MKNRPKKTNPKARKPQSRHAKVECEYCGEKLSRPSLAGHVQINHQKAHTGATITEEK